MLDAEKILITGATGRIAFPIARALAAAGHEVWGAARLKDPAARERLVGAAILPVALDISAGDFSGLPDDFTYVFHAAVDPGADDWNRCVETNAQMSGELLYHCRTAKGFVFCSTGSIYAYQGQRPLTESDPPGVPLRANYSISKVAARGSLHVDRPRSIGFRSPSSGSARPMVRRAGRPPIVSMRCWRAKPIRLHPDKPNNYNPIYEDDYVELGIRALEVAAVPPVVVNWAGSETVSVEDYCTYMGELVGVEPIFEYTPKRTRHYGRMSATCTRYSVARRCPGGTASGA